jgi:formate hydrogenlyase subunit 6/NADH:ubiquinone oxidoreductase subunit I
MPGTTVARPRQDGAEPVVKPVASATLDLAGLDALIAELRRRGWTVVGPTVRDGAVVHAEITTVDDLPRGMHDDQAPAHYRLESGGDQAVFGYTAAANAWKSHLFPADQLLWRGERGPDGGFTTTATDGEVPAYALLGVRSCDLHAIAIHDRVLTERAITDPHYTAVREAAFVVAVGCTRAGGTCFCADMGTGPRPDRGFDLALTELVDDGGHRFLVEVGSARGGDVLGAVPTTPASPDDVAMVDRLVADVTEQASGRIDATDLRDLLYDNVESPQWERTAQRCLACANCTLVCPTCFCTSVDDVTDLTGALTERHRVWDSCFTEEFSYIHGGNVRSSIASRYRQWATHKLAAWVDQFGTSGCVGCGRCITWCPAAIDITEEVRAIRDSARSRPGQ